MSSNRVLGFLIFAALGALVYWIANNTYWEEVTIPTGFRGEAVRNPFYSAQRLSDELGARSQWRRSLGVLPETKAVLVLSSWHWDLIQKRRQQIEQWVEAGGRLVLDRSLIGGTEEFERWSHIERRLLSRVEIRGEKDEDEEEADVVDDDGLRSKLFASEYPTCFDLNVQGEPQTGTRTSYSVCNLDASTRLGASTRAQWELRDAHGAQVIRMAIGKGSVTVVNGQPFRNSTLLTTDHASLFVAATQLRRGDAIFFLSEEERESLLSLMWAYGAPAVALALAALTLTLWRGAARLGPLQNPADPARRSLGEQIRGTGQFTLRFGGGRALHAAAARALQESAHRHILRYARMSSEERIIALARIGGVDSEALAEAMNYSGPRRAAELRNAIELLESTRRALLRANGR